jgi:O-succinylbenzoic acid--CoA ligase
MGDVYVSESTPEWLQQRAATMPDRLALIAGETRWTFRELNAAVEAKASLLSGRGADAGSVVALLGWNSAAYVATVHAAARQGAVLVALNTRLSGDEIEWQLKDAQVTHLVYDDANAAVVSRLRDALPGVAFLPMNTPLSFESRQRNSVAARAGPGLRRFDLDEVQTIVYTSGTTGRPKGAMLSYGNHFWSAIGSAFNLGVHADDRWLACLPLFHVGGLSILFRSLVYGMPVVLHESFDADRVNAAIDDDSVTIVSVVSVMLQRMLETRGEKPYPLSLRCVLLGGGPAPEALLQECAARGMPVVQTYGLTETASQVATLAPEEALARLGSAGKPLLSTELRIVRDDGSTCEPGEAGEILVRGPTVTRGYFNRPDETARALAGGWLHTGDVGYLDAEGYLYVLDRRDDLIVSGGENVYPAEVEAVLQTHPAVLEAGVFGVPDARWGQSPAAVVVLRPGVTLTAEELIAYCRERLASYKTPVRMSFTAHLPRNAAGKLLRRELSSL